MITYTLDNRRRFPPSLHGCGRPESNATGKREFSPDFDAVSNKRQAVSNASCDGDQSYVSSEKVETWRLSTEDDGQNPRPGTSIRMRLASSQENPMGGTDAVPQRSDHDAANSHYRQPRHTPETLVIPPYSAMTFSSAEIFKECENSVAFGQPCVRLLCDKNLFRALCWKPECIRVHFEDILEWFPRLEPEWSGLLLFTDGDILSRGETSKEVRPRNRLGVIPDGLQSAFLESSNHRRQAIKLMREHCGIQKRWSTSERPFLFWDWAGIDSKAKWLSAFNEFLSWARPLLDDTFTKYERMRDSGQTSGVRIDWRVEEWRWAYEIIIEPDGPPAESRKAQAKELKGLGPKGLLALEQKDRTVARGQRGLTESGKGNGRFKPSTAKVNRALSKASDSVSRRSSHSGVDDGTVKAGVDTDAKGGPQIGQAFTIANPPKGPRGWHAS
ncbi:hypothetical protein LTR27_011106 [Elasticomyces elasticus]|nr:hypothetical protein LTR27_011106 [Elasticomyces elasticus]